MGLPATISRPNDDIVPDFSHTVHAACDGPGSCLLGAAGSETRQYHRAIERLDTDTGTGDVRVVEHAGLDLRCDGCVIYIGADSLLVARDRAADCAGDDDQAGDKGKQCGAQFHDKAPDLKGEIG